MTLAFSGGNLIVSGNSGEKLLNTAEGLFHATDFVSNATHGLVSLSAGSASTTYSGGAQLRTVLDRTTDVLVASISTSATHCLGFMKATWSGSPAPNGDLWFDASGTSIDTFDAQCILDPRPTTDAQHSRHYMTAIALQTFYVTGGQLRFNERLILRASTANPTIPTFVTSRPAVTIEYRLLCGFFI